MTALGSRAARILPTAAVVLGALLAACGSQTAVPRLGSKAPADGVIRFRLDALSTGIAALTVEVTAPDMPLPIVMNVDVVGGVGEGTLRIPAGSARRIVIRAFDASAIETHRGEATIDVVEGTNPTLDVVLDPVFGGVPVVVTLGSYTVDVLPSDVTLRVGDPVQLVATVRDGASNVVTRPVTWGSGNPVVASADGTGRVVGLHVGETQVMASYGSFRGVVAVHVTGFIWASLVAGENHACGIDDRGTAYCWGNNVRGQLGDGTLADRSVPTPVAGGHVFQSITAGGLQSCAVTTDGDAYCWGRGDAVGTGTFDDSATPALVVGAHKWKAVDMGIFHACGVTTAGEGYCWGSGGSGQLGTGTTTSQPSPTLVTGGLTFAQISAGRDLSCGVTTGHDAYCWGYGGYGQLGNGSYGSSASPVLVLYGYSWDSVSAGGYHACGVRTDGLGQCWGDGGQGQLGYGSRDWYPAPMPVAGFHQFASIDAGSYHSCGTTTTGQALCWGLGTAGQMGNGTFPIAQTTPAAPPGDQVFTAVYASGSPWWLGYSESGGFSCGRTVNGGAYCWGDDNYGQLGDGATTLRPIPGSVRDP